MSEQTLNLVNNIVINAEQQGVAKLVLDNQSYDGKHVIYNGETLISFGSYSYLGLEVDPRLKNAAINAIEDYGIQYPSSRIYSSLPIYQTLTNLMEEIFQSNVVLTTSLSLGHMGVMPVVVGKKDVLILDQHVHSSVQDAAQRLKSKGIDITIVRHNDLESLERKIVEYSNKYEKIWYAIDGIYSMYGDTAPIEELEELLNKYSKFHVYADDAHGVSSFGHNGAGWILSKIKLHPKLILSTGMAKAFGTMGGIFVIPNQGLFEKVKNCTGSLIFSGPHPIPIIGSSVASAKIHLSTEIIEKQIVLQEKIRYCSELLKREGIPDISDNTTPIFFIAIGKISAGYRLVRRMIEDGFLTNLASFPAVSESCTGLRFTITLHHTIEEIEDLVLAFKKNYPLVLREENLSVDSIRRAFRKVKRFPKTIVGENLIVSGGLEVEIHKSILELEADVKDKLLQSGAYYDEKTLELLELSFSGNPEREDNWKFYYVSIRDQNGGLILTTLFTVTTTKDDMLASASISEQIELDRNQDRYLLTSKSIVMGTLISEGQHIYIDKTNSEWKSALEYLIVETEKLRELEGANVILFRDFEKADQDIMEIFKGNGFLKIDLPDGHIIENLNWNGQSEYMQRLTKRRRKYVKDKAVKNEVNFSIEIKKVPSVEELKSIYNLYKNVNGKSFEINTFNIPPNLYQNLLEKSNKWEVLVVKREGVQVASMLSFIGGDAYYPVLVGMDYDYLSEDIYPQVLWQTVKRAGQMGLNTVHLGYTASQNKRKFGAVQTRRFGLVKTSDNYHQQLIELY